MANRNRNLFVTLISENRLVTNLFANYSQIENYSVNTGCDGVVLVGGIGSSGCIVVVVVMAVVRVALLIVVGLLYLSVILVGVMVLLVVVVVVVKGL